MGVAIMSRYTFGLDPESSRYLCLDVEGFPLENHWYLAYPAGKQLSVAARAFLDLSVSYTHLDVYKRQVSCTRGSSRAKWSCR